MSRESRRVSLTGVRREPIDASIVDVLLPYCEADWREELLAVTLLARAAIPAFLGVWTLTQAGHPSGLQDMVVHIVRLRSVDSEDIVKVAWRSH